MFSLPSAHSLSVAFAFRHSPVTEKKKEISRQYIEDEITDVEFIELAAKYLREEERHKCDCALHNGPALSPGRCNCGTNPHMTPEVYGSEYP